MKNSNGLFLLITFGAMAAGVMVPGLGQPLRHLAAACLMTQLLLAFLATAVPGAGFTRATFKGMPLFLFFSLLVAPAFCCTAFHLFLPHYALGALLVSGSAVGVLSPFFGLILRADNPFIIACVILSSLLLPLTMPCLVLGYFWLTGQEATGGLWTAFMNTALGLAGYIIIPFIVAKLLWRFKASAATGILARRYWLSVICVATSIFIIFSQYSEPLRAAPGSVLAALLGALALSVVLIGIGLFSGMRQSVERKLGCVIAMGTRNNILMAIISAQFFGLPEVLMAAMYSVPLFLLLMPYTWYANHLRRAESGNG